MTEEQAIAFAKNKLYECMTDRQIAELQLEQDRLCMPFDVFHKALESALGRPVYTHEIGLDRGELIKELRGEKPAPTLEEILGLIPKEKLVVVEMKEGGDK